MSVAEQTSVRATVRVKLNRASDHLHRVEREGSWLTIGSIVAGAITVLLTTAVFPVVREPFIPIVAGVFSMFAVIAGGLHKHRVESRLPQLQEFVTRLEGLATRMDQGQLTDAQIAEEFAALLRTCPPIPGPGRRFPPAAAKGVIHAPGHGDVVGTYFITRGEADRIGRNVHLWLTVDREGTLWPKTGRIFIDHGEWEQTVHEPYASEFDLTLWAVSPRVDLLLCRWLEEGERLGAYAQFALPSGMKWIARVEGLRRRDRGDAPAAAFQSYIGIPGSQAAPNDAPRRGGTTPRDPEVRGEQGPDAVSLGGGR